MYQYRGLTRSQRVLLRSLLKQARLSAGLNQGQAGDLLGQDQSFISRIESGDRCVEFSEIEQLAEIYRQPVSFFETLSKLRQRKAEKALKTNEAVR